MECNVQQLEGNVRRLEGNVWRLEGNVRRLEEVYGTVSNQPLQIFLPILSYTSHVGVRGNVVGMTNVHLASAGMQVDATGAVWCKTMRSD